LAQVNYEEVAKIRRDNFAFYHKHLAQHNEAKEIMDSETCVPFCYPLLLKSPINLGVFFNKKIYIPSLWNDVTNRVNPGFFMENHISKNLLPLPLDHRYRNIDLSDVITFIKNNPI
jgi:hypothetical protein